MSPRLVRTGPPEVHEDGTVTLRLLGFTALGWLAIVPRAAASAACSVRPRVLWPVAFVVALALLAPIAWMGRRC